VITVTGVARREVQPDGVSWRADAFEVDSEARPAFDRCTARLNQLTEQLSAVGNVTTETVSVRPERDEETAIRTGRVEAIGGVRVRADPGRVAESRAYTRSKRKAATTRSWSSRPPAIRTSARVT
jgi:uncharacterized protein YggE